MKNSNSVRSQLKKQVEQNSNLFGGETIKDIKVTPSAYVRLTLSNGFVLEVDGYSMEESIDDYKMKYLPNSLFKHFDIERPEIIKRKDGWYDSIPNWFGEADVADVSKRIAELKLDGVRVAYRIDKIDELTALRNRGSSFSYKKDMRKKNPPYYRFVIVTDIHPKLIEIHP